MAKIKKKIIKSLTVLLLTTNCAKTTVMFIILYLYINNSIKKVNFILFCDIVLCVKHFNFIITYLKVLNIFIKIEKK